MHSPCKQKNFLNNQKSSGVARATRCRRRPPQLAFSERDRHSTVAGCRPPAGWAKPWSGYCLRCFFALHSFRSRHQPHEIRWQIIADELGAELEPNGKGGPRPGGGHSSSLFSRAGKARPLVCSRATPSARALTSPAGYTKLLHLVIPL